MNAAGTQALEALVDGAGPLHGREALPDAYRGVMLGMAVGNGLGLPVEGESKRGILRHYAEGITDVDPQERARPWDDDLAQAALLAEVLAEAGELDPDVFATRLVTWARDNGRGIGNLTRLVIQEFEQGQDPFEAARRAWTQDPLSGAGNGAVMRCPPVALRHPQSGAELVRTARASALVTHYDPRCEWSTVVTAIAIATCLRNTPVDLDDLAVAVEAIPGEGWPSDAIDQVVEATRAVSKSSLDDLGLDDPMDMGYTLKTMQVGLWCMEQEKDFEGVLTAVVNSGGDTDTNGAVGGAVMGALCGASGIPQRWLDNIHDSERLAELADRLYLVAGTNRPDPTSR